MSKIPILQLFLVGLPVVLMLLLAVHVASAAEPLNKVGPATVTATQYDAGGKEVVKAGELTDGDEKTRWLCPTPQPPLRLGFDMGVARTVGKVRIANYFRGANFDRGFKVVDLFIGDALAPATGGTPAVATRELKISDAAGPAWTEIMLDKPVKGRILTLRVQSNWGGAFYAVNEVEIYTVEADTPSGTTNPGGTATPGGAGPGTAAADTAEAIRTASLLFHPFVFAGTAFPSCDFAQPEQVKALIGPYTLRTRFFDAAGQEVQAAAKPGRYGAIVEVAADSGAQYKRFVTLYHLAKPIDWNTRVDSRQWVLWPEWGVKPEVAQAMAPLADAQLKHGLQAYLETDPNSAVLLAALSELQPDQVAHELPRMRLGHRYDIIALDREWWFQLKRKTGDVAPYRYLTWLPEGYDADPNQRWPLMIYLCGSGEFGTDLKMVTANGVARRAAKGDKFPFVLIAPQSPAHTGWVAAQVDELLDLVLAKYRIDPDRVYVTGLSSGGGGTWDYASRYGQRLAAIVPICAGGDPYYLGALKTLPVWCFHGAKDTTVPIQEDQDMVDALKRAGNPNVKFTIFPDANHNCWELAYNDQAVYDWLLAQKRTQPGR